jgi:hypothetical protein
MYIIDQVFIKTKDDIKKHNIEVKGELSNCLKSLSCFYSLSRNWKVKDNTIQNSKKDKVYICKVKELRILNTKELKHLMEVEK